MIAAMSTILARIEIASRYHRNMPSLHNNSDRLENDLNRVPENGGDT